MAKAKKTLTVIALLGITGYLTVGAWADAVDSNFHKKVWKQSANEIMAEVRLRESGSPAQSRKDMSARTTCSNYRFAMNEGDTNRASHYRNKDNFSRGCRLLDRRDAVVDKAISRIQTEGWTEIANDMSTKSTKCMVKDWHWSWGADIEDGNTVDTIIFLQKDSWERANGKEWNDYGCYD